MPVYVTLGCKHTTVCLTLLRLHKALPLELCQCIGAILLLVNPF